MRLVIPLQLEMDSEQEPPEAAFTTAAYCRVCFAVIPGHLLGRHLQAAHPEWSGDV